MAKALKLPENPTPEQFEKLKKPLVKAILESTYTDGVDDLTVQMPGEGGAIASGKFLDRRTGAANRVFTYVIRPGQGGEILLDYKPLTGDFAEPTDPDYLDDDDIKALHRQRWSFAEVNTRLPLLEFNEGEAITDEWIANYESSVEARLFAALEEAGLGHLIFEEPDYSANGNGTHAGGNNDEPEWARGL